MKAISFISCCFNEGQNLVDLYHQLDKVMQQYTKKLDWQLMLVDDGSTDDTSRLVKEMIANGDKIHYLKLSRNFGKEAALTAGIDHCIDVDAAILIDADLQHPTETIPELIQKWEEGFDMVVAVPKRRSYSIVDKLFSWTYHRLLSYTAHHSLVIDGGDFRILSKKHIEYLQLVQEKSRYMKGLYSFPGGAVAEVFYDEDQRKHGKSAFTFRKRCALAVNGIVSMTTSPIRLFSLLGFMILAVSMTYLVYIFFGIIINGKNVPGFASLLFSIVILNGLIMVQIGIQGEYIAQILKETKNRPIYFVDKIIKQRIKK